MSSEPRRLTRREAQLRTRERLLDAAAMVVKRSGYAGASLEAVAQAAGYTKGAVYSNFRTKADLLLALLDRHVEAEARTQARELQGRTLEEFVETLDEAFDRQVADDPLWIVLEIEFWLAALRDPEVKARVVAHAEKRRSLAASMIDGASVDDGLSTRFTADELAVLTHALGLGLALHYQLQPESIDRSLIVRAARALFGLPVAARQG